MQVTSASTIENRYRALLVGATGLVGFALLDQLLSDWRCINVTVIARRPLSRHIQNGSDKLNVIIADFDRMEKALEDVEVDVIFCTLGTTMKTAKTREAFRMVDYEYPARLGEWASTKGTIKMIVVSAVGANSKSKLFYSQIKGELEEYLRSLKLHELHLLRPSLLLGNRKEFRLGEQVAMRVLPLLRPFMIGPLRPYSMTIRDKEVAAAMRAAANGELLDIPQATEGSVWIYENDQIIAAASRIWNSTCV